MTKKFLKHGLVALLLTILAATPSSAKANVLSLSLKQCIDLALKNNIEVLVAKARVQQASGQRDILNVNLLPHIEAVASQQRTWWENFGALGFPGVGVLGPFNTFDARIMVSQRIVDFSAMARAQAGRIQWESSQLEIELASQQVLLATSLAYVQALGDTQELASSYEDVRLAQHFLSLSLHQLDAGLASQVDVARDRTQLAQQMARQEALRLNVIKSQLELKRLVRIPLAQPIALTDVLINEIKAYLPEDKAITYAKENRMEMRVANANSDYSLAELKASRREYLPKIDLTGDWGETGVTPDKSVAHAADAMVKISLPIWEGGRIAGEIKENEGLNEEQRVKADDLNWTIEEDARLALATLVSTRAQLDAVKKVEGFAQRELDLARDRFTAGLGDNIQVIDAQDALADSKDKYVQALAQYDQAELNYFGALGDPRGFELKGTSR